MMQNTTRERLDSDTEYDLVVVDDDSMFTALLARQLRRSDKRFMIIHDSEEALAYLKQATPAALLVDLRMPKLNGLELLEALGNDSVQSPPNVFLCSSGPPPPATLADIKSLGAILIMKDELLQKNFLQDLLSNHPPSNLHLASN